MDAEKRRRAVELYEKRKLKDAAKDRAQLDTVLKQSGLTDAELANLLYRVRTAETDSEMAQFVGEYMPLDIRIHRSRFGSPDLELASVMIHEADLQGDWLTISCSQLRRGAAATASVEYGPIKAAE